MSRIDRPGLVGGRAPTRRDLLRAAGHVGAITGVHALLPAWARAQPGLPSAPEPSSADEPALVELVVDRAPIRIAGRRATAITLNGTVPGPLLRLREGQDTILRVTNRLDEDTSIHWHGVLVPPEMDGVPGVSFPGILAGTTFEYRFRLKQYGTYWYHSHSGLQEQLGHYGPLLIEPAGGYPYAFDREHTIVLSDWTFEDPHRVLAKLKKQGNYYNSQRLTAADFFRDVAREGFLPTVRDRWMWASMRMDPTDILDVTATTYTYLLNGLAPEGWIGRFRPGERVLLHVINASAATYFDLRIPGLPLTVVQADGQFVQPVETDEVRLAVAETYDFIVQPTEDRAYAVFAETMDRSGYALGTLAPRDGMIAATPPRRKRPRLTMADMGMAHGAHGGMDHGGMDHGEDHGAHASPPPPADGAHEEHGAIAGSRPVGAAEDEVAVAGAIRTTNLRPPGTIPPEVPHEDDRHGPGNAMVPDRVGSRLHEPGIGLGDDGWRVLTYADLRSLHGWERRAPDREIELHLTGNMERFMWSIDGVPFDESDLIELRDGERLRLTMVNDTMMNHPMHLHGMWMELENGHGESIPRKHTVNVQPAERISLLIDVDAPGMWAFHCHILYHMDTGMFRVVRVSAPGEVPAAPTEVEDVPPAPGGHEHHG